MATLSLVTGAGAETVAAPVAQEVARGVWLIPGEFRPDRQPDGNSVVFEAPAGLVVVDTGRHRWHREAILALAGRQEKPIAAIVNTHWHLDHVSGNPGIRSAHPGLRVFASSAIDDALTGFLPASARDSAQYLEDAGIPESMREDIRGDLQAIEGGAALRPDVVIHDTGVLAIGGRAFGVHLAQDAATAGDVWLYDEATRVAVLGDLVTLPAPFLDTACPDGWEAALGEVASVQFETAIPGHGAPMNRAQFERYRSAFTAFIDCYGSTSPASECATQWADAVAPLLADAANDRKRAQGMAAYYVDVLRASAGRSEHCGT